MKRISPFVSVSAFAQTAVIQSIAPNSGPDSGGTVVIRVRISTSPSCLLPARRR
jgi:hypothetical protein